jgi:sugar lactone lactonase YvrE
MWAADAENGTIVMNVTAQCLGLFIDINNTLYCATSDEHQVIAKSLDEGAYPIEVVAGNGSCGSTADQLCLPNGIFVDLNFNLYIADFKNHRIQKFQLGEMNGQTVVGINVPETISLNGPTAVVLDADNYLFIADTWQHRIIGSGPTGFRCLVGCVRIIKTVDTTLNGPRSLAFDNSGNLFVSDHGNNRILKFVLATNSCGMSD